MSPNPQRGTPAGDATLAIHQLARATGGDVQELQTLYVLEAFLARIAESEFRADFVLKGGVLLAAFALHRPTKDIDLPDGVVFDRESIAAAVIRDADEYAGVRVKVVGVLGRARVTIGIDVNFGDPIWPAPELIELPGLVSLGHPPITLLGYPLTMALAEKILTVLDRGEANTRWRDFADVYSLTRVHTVDAEKLRTSLEVVATYRQVQLTPVLPQLAEMPPRVQPKWAPWRTWRNRVEDLPGSFDEILAEVSRFADPVLERALMGNWNPHAAAWGANLTRMTAARDGIADWLALPALQDEREHGATHTRGSASTGRAVGTRTTRTTFP